MKGETESKGVYQSSSNNAFHKTKIHWSSLCIVGLKHKPKVEKIKEVLEGSMQIKTVDLTSSAYNDDFEKVYDYYVYIDFEQFFWTTEQMKEIEDILNDKLAQKNEEIYIVHKRSMVDQIFLGGLHPNVSEKDLIGLFEDGGNLINVEVKRRRNGKSRCFGFATFLNSRDYVKELVAQRYVGFGDDRIEIKPIQNRSERERRHQNNQHHDNQNNYYNRSNQKNGKRRGNVYSTHKNDDYSSRHTNDVMANYHSNTGGQPMQVPVTPGNQAVPMMPISMMTTTADGTQVPMMTFPQFYPMLGMQMPMGSATESQQPTMMMPYNFPLDHQMQIQQYMLQQQQNSAAFFQQQQQMQQQLMLQQQEQAAAAVHAAATASPTSNYYGISNPRVIPEVAEKVLQDDVVYPRSSNLMFVMNNQGNNVLLEPVQTDKKIEIKNNSNMVSPISPAVSCANSYHMSPEIIEYQNSMNAQKDDMNDELEQPFNYFGLGSPFTSVFSDNQQ